MTPVTAPAPRPAAADTAAALRRAEELEHVDSRWTHTGAPYEWDASAVIRALVADLDATRLLLDAAHKRIDALTMPDRGLENLFADMEREASDWRERAEDAEAERDVALAALPDPRDLESCANMLDHEDGRPYPAGILRASARAIRALDTAPVPAAADRCPTCQQGPAVGCDCSAEAAADADPVTVPDVPRFLRHRAPWPA